MLEPSKASTGAEGPDKGVRFFLYLFIYFIYFGRELSLNSIIREWTFMEKVPYNVLDEAIREAMQARDLVIQR